MTRNNLDEQLRWFLNNATVSTPNQANTNISRTETPSQGKGTYEPTQLGLKLSGEFAPPAHQQANPTPSTFRTPTHGADVHGGLRAQPSSFDKDAEMARLLGLQQPKKRSLITKQQQQLPTPVSTTVTGRFEHAYRQSLKTG